MHTRQKINKMYGEEEKTTRSPQAEIALNNAELQIINSIKPQQRSAIPANKDLQPHQK